MSLCPTPYWGNQSLGESPVPGLSGWKVPEATLKACVPFFFLPYPCPLDTSQLLQHHSREVLSSIGGMTLRKEAGGGNPNTRRHRTHIFSKLFQPRGSTSFGCSRHSFTAGGPSWIWRLWARAEGSRHARSKGQSSLAGTSFPALSAP